MSRNPAPDTVQPDAKERVKTARLRAAAVRARLHLATDALAAADLLLGLNASLGAVSRGPSR